MAQLITLDEIKSAQQRLRGVAAITPLVALRQNGDGPQLLLKAESLQPIGSFKIRGAYNFIAQLTRDQLSRGVITYSSGNHAQGVAYAARALGAKSVIVMPSNTPAIKLDATRALGAEIVMVGPASDERKERAEALAAEHGYTVVPPYDHPHIIAGQATCALEILEQAPLTDLILAPVGGGGLSSGSAAVAKLSGGRTVVFGVEPELAGDAATGFRTGHRITATASDSTRTIADGLRTQSVGELNFAHLRAFATGIITITEDEIRAAMRAIALHASLVAEPSGAVTTAAWLFHRSELPPVQHPVAIISGGNVDPAMLAEILAESPASR
jgi:threonine dehydratase